MKTKHLLFFLLTGLLALAALAFYIGRIPSPAAAQSLQPPVYLPILLSSTTTQPVILPPPDQASQRIKVPAGFAIRIYAQDLSKPRLMTTGPDGWVYVAQMGSGQIARLPDRDANGLSDETEIVASGLTQPHNLEFYKGWMYVAENGLIERFRDSNQDGVYETRQTVTENIPGAGGHSSRTLHFGPDGKLYVSAGSSCNACEETDPRRAAILRFNPDGSIPSDNPFAKDPDPRKQAVWASGLRNSVDFLWSPEGKLYASQNGVDGLGDNNPPEEIINTIQPGKWYGWPYCYTPKLGLNVPTKPEIQDTRLPLPSGMSCGQAVPALLTDAAHAAPLGMTRADRSNFPTGYRDDFFVAYHGSWNTTSSTDYRDCKIERVVIEKGSVVRSETFANGWRAPGELCGSANTWGRPAGLTVGKDGALYISDDKSGRVYRVVYIGQ